MTKISIGRAIRLLAISFTLFAISTLVYSAEEHTLSIDDPSVINLSKFVGQRIKIRPITLEKIDDSMGAIGLMLADQPRRWGDPEIVSPKKENDDKILVSRYRETVSRLGKTLTIVRQNGSPLKFRDWFEAASKTREGDGASFRYAGILPKSNFHQIDVHYEHDSPGSFFVSAGSGKIMYAHTGSDLVSISKNGQKLLVMNDGLNPPFGIIVSALAEDGHGVELACSGPANKKPRIIPFFKGWHIDPYTGFNVVLLVETDEQGTYEAIPVRFSKKNSEWHVYAPNPQRFVQLVSLSCWQ